MKRLCCLLLAVFALVPFSASAQNQADPPLLMSGTRDRHFVVQTDLYRWTSGRWEAVTTDGYKSGFALAPDGGQIAYRAVPPLVRKAMEEKVDVWPSAVWDLRLLDMQTGTTRDVAVQGTAFIVDAKGHMSGGINRSDPLWSPDGSMLAWTEQDYPAKQTARLILYDLKSEQTRALDDALPQMTMSEDGLPSLFDWGESGIVIFTNDPTTNAETLRVYHPADGSKQVLPAPDPDNDAWLPTVGPLWVASDSGDQIFVLMDNLYWQRIDPVSGSMNRLDTHLELISATAPPASIQLIVSAYAPEDSRFQIVRSDGSHQATLNNFPTRQHFVTAPSGKAAAFVQGDKPFLVEDALVTPLPLPDGLSNISLYWGQSEWRAGAADEGAMG